MDIKSDYISLNSKVLATYSIVYTSNFSSQIQTLSDLTDKSQVRATEFESFYQQNNLIHIDMLFPNVLADIALEVFLGKASSFDSYIKLNKSFQIIDIESDRFFFKSRIEKFVDYLLYSDISKMDLSSGELNHSIQYQVDDGVSILCFNSSNYMDLIQLSLYTIELIIDLNKSYVTLGGEVILHLVIVYEKGPLFN